MKLQARFALSHAATMLVALALLVVTLGAFQVARQHSASVHDNYIPSVNIASRLLVRLEQMENAEFMYFLPGQARSTWLRRFDEAAGAFEQDYLLAEGVATSPRERQYFAAMGQAYGAFLYVDRRMRALVRQGRILEAQNMNATESLNVAAQLRENAQAFFEFNLAESQRAREAQDVTVGLAERLALSLMLLGLALGALIWWRDSKDFVEPILALTAATAAMAKGRHYPVDHPAARTINELAALQGAFNHASAELQMATERLHLANETLESQVAERTRALGAANQQLESLIEEMKVVDRLKTNFIAVTSHELLTPINFITGFGSALEDELLGPLTPGQHDAVEKIMGGAERLTRMVRNTLEHTQLEAGTIAVVPAVTDYGSVAADVVAAIRPAVMAKRQELEVSIADPLPLVWADPGRAGQVLFELLDNAVKFTAEGKKVRLVIKDAGDGVTTEVEDAGMGIPADALSELFKPFYQVDFSSTRQHGGLGLGLAIAYQLVARMGDMLLVQSRPGRGTSFRFKLPLAGKDAVLEAEASSERG